MQNIGLTDVELNYSTSEKKKKPIYKKVRTMCTSMKGTTRGIINFTEAD